MLIVCVCVSVRVCVCVFKMGSIKWMQWQSNKFDKSNMDDTVNGITELI